MNRNEDYELKLKTSDVCALMQEVQEYTGRSVSV